MKPKSDDQGWYKNIQDRFDLEDRTFKCYDANKEMPVIIANPKYGESTIGQVLMCSGMTHSLSTAFSNTPSPVGKVYYSKTFRNDEKDGHLNVDHRLHWQDKNKKAYYLQFNDTEEHVQDYLIESGIKPLTKPLGWPTIESGSFNEYREELGDMSFGRCLPPWKKK